MIELPEEDSPDMTYEEIAGAVAAPTSEVMAEVLGKQTCPICQGAVQVTRHVLRRRAPNYYARVLFVCKDGHKGSVTFRAQFLGGT